MYSVLSFYSLINGIYVLFLWIIMDIILWHINISIDVFMGMLVFFMVFLLILLIIFPDVYISDAILILRALTIIIIHS